MDSIGNTSLTENQRAIVRVSVASDGTQANGSSSNPSLSADGRYVAFASSASNLVSGDTNNAWDIFVRDLHTGQTTRVNVTPDGSQAYPRRYYGDEDDYYSHNYGDYSQPSLSADGRYVAFASAANLVPEDINNSRDIFVRDLQTGQTTRVNLPFTLSQINLESSDPILSLDGRYVYVALNFTGSGNFFSRQRDMALTDEIWVYDLQTGETSRLEEVSEFTPVPTYDSFSLSQDGRYLAFSSDNDRLVPGDTNAFTDLFVRDLSIPLPENPIEPIISTEDNDDLIGTDEPEIFMGNSGNDGIFSGAGNDRIEGNSGNDFLDGGSGEDLLLGGQDRDWIFGREERDRLFGESEEDTLSGDEGNDELYGNQGDDFLDGGAGEDLILGGQDRDLILGGENNDRLFGNQGDDLIYGEAGADLISGGEGNDIVDGGEGNDTLLASLGNDLMMGNAGDDRIYSKNSCVIYGNQGSDTIFGRDGRETLYGGQGDDSIVGDDLDFFYPYERNNNDLLSGDFGNDFLVGTDGTSSGMNEVDTLVGGEGSDTFALVGHSAYYVDWGDADYALITDFAPSEDTIILDGRETYQLAEISTPIEGQSPRIDTYIYHIPVNPDRESDLVAIIQGVSGLSLESPTFAFYLANSAVLI